MTEKIGPGVDIILDRPGALACGKYQRGKVYQVDAKEAERLISAKGFRRATPEDKPSTQQSNTVNPAGGES